MHAEGRDRARSVPTTVRETGSELGGVSGPFRPVRPPALVCLVCSPYCCPIGLRGCPPAASRVFSSEEFNNIL